MEMTMQQFYNLFNDGIFGDTIDTINSINKMEKAGIIQLTETQKLKLQEYLDRVTIGR